MSTDINTMSEPTNARRGSTKAWVVAIAIPLAIVMAALLVYQASFAAFTAKTDTAQNNWETGTVLLTNSKSGQAAFTETNLTAGQTGGKDITVTYSGSNAATVKMYAAAGGETQSLASSLTLTITRDDAVPVFTGTLAQFQAKTDWNSGLGDVPMNPGAKTAVYHIAWSVASNAPQAATGSVVFVWEAQG
ncbi:hypothetical protein ACDF64_03105 [Agromyces sp. MMS24-JH15]|uniref:hypothetical protein n=1 Tax=Agromyces sp. MMS24-JH15 TaxID=3243765 RepID=UPI003749028F